MKTGTVLALGGAVAVAAYALTRKAGAATSSEHRVKSADDIARLGPISMWSGGVDPKAVTSKPGWKGNELVSSPYPGIRGMGATGTDVVGPVDPNFQAGRPGTYVVRMRAESVPLDNPWTETLNPSEFTSQLQSRGIDATVLGARFIGSGPATSTNWALDTIDDLFGRSSGTKRAVADRTYEFTVRINAPRSSGVAGMGAVPGVVVGVAVLAGIAIILSAINHWTGVNVVTEFVKSLGSGVGGALSESAVPLLVFAAAAAAGIFLLRKSGARVRTSKFSF